MAAKFNVRRAIGYVFLLAFIIVTPASAQESFPPGWQYPIPGQPITAYYGADNSGYGAEKSHTGIDIGTGSKPDAMILASGDGIVTMVKSGGAGFQGMTVCVFHGWDSAGKPVTTIYAHNRNPLVQVGDVVHKGQEIVQAYGFMPPNGVRFQPHLHFTYQVSETCSYSPSQFRDPMSLPTIVKKWDGGTGSSTPSVLTTVREVVVETAPKAVGPGIGIVMVIFVVMGISGFKKDPIRSIKQVLYLVSKVHGYWARRKLLRELSKAQEQHGLIRIGFPTIIAIGMVFGGFQTIQFSASSSSCHFQPVLETYPRGSWGFGVKTKFQEYHTGVDPMAPTGTPVPASATGKVVWASWWPGDPYYKQNNLGHGNTVVIETFCNGEAWYHYYAHLSQINVAVGDRVDQNIILGLVGNTGASTRPHLHFAISDKGPTVEHSFQDWYDPDQFVKDHSQKSESFISLIKITGLQVGGWTLIVLAFLVIFLFGETPGIFGLLRRSLVPGIFFAGLTLYAQLAPALAVTTFDTKELVKIAWNSYTQPVTTTLPVMLPLPQFQAGASTSSSMQELPPFFIEQVKVLGPRVTQIAMAEDVPPEVLFTLWLKESGGRMVNPANGEGLCGFYSRVQGGRDYFPPGPITEAEVLRQLGECAKEFHKHNRTGTPVTFNTTDFNVLGPIYMAYNGNIDCHGGSFASWKAHPYVMNGYDAEHQGMVARDGKGGCVPLQIIGSVPAHLRVAQILRGAEQISDP